MLNIYPKIIYNGIKLTDLSRRYIFQKLDTYNRKTFFMYRIKDWMPPEHIAYDFYGSCDYVWIILALNNIVNVADDIPLMTITEINNGQAYTQETSQGQNFKDVNNYWKHRTDWLMPHEYVYDYVKTKYGEDNVEKLHHYEWNDLLFKPNQPLKYDDEHKVTHMYINKEEFVPWQEVKKITNYDYEDKVNELKRDVKVLYPELVKQLEEDVMEMFRTYE